MKTINVTFDDMDFVLLTELKKELSWHDFILENVRRSRKKNGKSFNKKF